MRKQASESPEVTGGLGGSHPRSQIGAAAGRPPARGVGGPSPPRGLGLAERVSSPPAKAKAGPPTRAASAATWR
jgi:hypothetical protein